MRPGPYLQGVRGIQNQTCQQKLPILCDVTREGERNALEALRACWALSPNWGPGEPDGGDSVDLGLKDV